MSESNDSTSMFIETDKEVEDLDESTDYEPTNKKQKLRPRVMNDDEPTNKKKKMRPIVMDDEAVKYLLRNHGRSYYTEKNAANRQKIAKDIADNDEYIQEKKYPGTKIGRKFDALKRMFKTKVNQFNKGNAEAFNWTHYKDFVEIIDCLDLVPAIKPTVKSVGKQRDEKSMVTTENLFDEIEEQSPQEDNENICIKQEEQENTCIKQEEQEQEDDAEGTDLNRIKAEVSNEASFLGFPNSDADTLNYSGFMQSYDDTGSYGSSSIVTDSSHGFLFDNKVDVRTKMLNFFMPTQDEIVELNSVNSVIIEDKTMVNAASGEENVNREFITFFFC